MPVPTFDDLVAIEPKLGELLADAKRYRGGPEFCANAVWYGYDGDESMKNRLEFLVGWDRGVERKPEPVGANGIGEPIAVRELVLRPLSEFKVKPRGIPAKTPNEAVLKSSDAYDMAYQTLYDALPDCGERCECQAVMSALVG
jgi:hypothetical protein